MTVTRSGRIMNHTGRAGFRPQRGGAVFVAVAVAIAIGSAIVGPARATPPYVPVTSALPPLPVLGQHHPTGACPVDGMSCLQVTIAQMRRETDRLAETCDHNAVFALTYLRITQTFSWWVAGAGKPDDGRYLERLDYIFARRYFAAYQHWAGGERSEVPGAWQVAFAAARERSDDGPGDALLGINAHVYEDLPFVLEETGLVRPNGASHKPDYDRSNAIFVDTIDPLVAELAVRFDSQIGVLAAAGQAGPAGFVQLMATAREDVWREAEQLVDAPTPAARELVAREVHRRALVHAQLILATNRYHPPATSTMPRDAYCRQHHHDPAPEAYAFGRA